MGLSTCSCPAAQARLRRARVGCFSGGGGNFVRGLIRRGKFRKGNISPPSQIPKPTLPHAHTALPKPPDFAGENFATFFQNKSCPQHHSPSPPASRMGSVLAVLVLCSGVSGQRGGRPGGGGGKSTDRSGRQNAATRRNMRREERVTVQSPVKEQQPDGMSHGGQRPMEIPGR